MSDRPHRAELPEGLLTRSFALTRDQFGEDGTFEGLACAFGVRDSYGTEWKPGAWERGGLTPDKQFALLYMHDCWYSPPLGVFSAEERSDGLWIMGKYDDTADGRDARVRAMSGSAAELSVGFYCVATDPEDDNIFEATRLQEVSQIVRNFAAQPGAGMTTVRAVPTEAEIAQDRRRRIAVARLRLA
jgi:HK97 family phage prohead protease